MNCIQCVILRLRGLHFHIDGFFGELENWMLLSCFCFFFPPFLLLLAMVGAEVGENYTQRPNRSLLSKASQMHLSELNTYELCTGVGDDSSVTGADREGGVGRWKVKETESDTQVWMRRTRSRTRMHTHMRGSQCTHTHAPPLKANAIKGRITAKSIRTNLREMK